VDDLCISVPVESMRELIKQSLKDSRVEPYARWLVKRSRGIQMPFDLVKNEIYDRQAFEIIRRVLAPDANCVDVGCHEGLFLEEFLRCAPRGRHFAFEPIPMLADLLKTRFPTVKIFPFALGNCMGETTFYVIPEAPALSGLNRREFVDPAKRREGINVRMERLDNLIPEGTKIDLLKIDVEGAEGLVIEGALETIRRDKPYIIFEHGRASSMAFGISSSRLYDLLVGECDLRLSSLRSWLHGEPVLSNARFGEPGEWYFLAHPNQ
jgi:FkbM family methyltransferase